MLLSFAVCRVSGQSRYDAHAAFAPLFYPHDGTACRSVSGAPGPAYWQNRADYEVAARFDTARKTVTGEVTITYTNESPDTLSFLWLYLDQNIDAIGSRASRMKGPGSGNATAGFRLDQVAVQQGDRLSSVPYLVDGTRMRISLPHPLAPHGSVCRLNIRYAYKLLPSGGSGRSGYLDTRDGRIFEVSYWYPRLCVYDDLRGWNTLPFLGDGEFYMDYGSIDYRITLPSGMLVAGAGKLVNADEVLTSLALHRLETARRSDSTILIRDPTRGEPATRPGDGGMLRWHFHMDSTRDVAWAASAAFVWDAARIRLPGGDSAVAMSFYPRESRGDSRWGRATEYLRYSVEAFSRSWYKYPYPVAINVAGPVGGMEFPGITFDWWKEGDKGLFALVSHEIGHSWYPMIVGSNERRNAWMDEGFNTFIDLYAQAAFHRGEYAPKRDGEYAPRGGNPAEEIIPYITRPGIAPVASLADALPGRDVHPLEYFKTAFGLVLLRDVILGAERFDYALRQYTRDWAYKHPSPWDFFREINNATGEDLSWFWRGWVLHNWTVDEAVKDVRYVGGNPARGALITLENLGEMPMPAPIRIVDAGDSTRSYTLPVEIWQRGARWTFRVNTSRQLKRVEVDPAHILPDTDRSNNTWIAP